MGVENDEEFFVDSGRRLLAPTFGRQPSPCRPTRVRRIFPGMSERPLRRFIRPITRLNLVRVSIVGLFVLLALMVLSRAPSDAPRPANAAETAADGQLTQPTAGVGGDSAPEALHGAVERTPVETGEPSLAGGCFRPGSSRAEVRSVMGAPDTVVFGAWEYGRSSVTFGYGVVLDYSNQGGNLRLC